MNFCLANAPTSAEFGDPDELRSISVRADTCRPQLGILNLAAVLEHYDHKPKVIDLNYSFYRYAVAGANSEIDVFAEVAAAEIAATEAEVYGFGSICSGYPLTIRIAKLVKSLQPEAIILFGGPQASVVANQTLEAFPFVDFVLRGESEGSLPIFLDELAGARKFERVAGLTYRGPFGVQRNVDAPLVADLDILPSAAYHLTGELRGLKRASLEMGRGCPFACTFCSTNDFFRRKFRLRSPERVLEDMRAIEAEYGIRDFDLVHDMFTVDAKRVRAFCDAMVDSGEGYTWSCSARTDCVDESLIEAMAAAGCNGMFFGVETGSERMQKIIDKHLDTARAHEIIDIAERAGIRSTVSLITGFPQEDREDLKDTLRMYMHSVRVPGSSPQLNLLAPLANTPLHLQYKDRMTLDLLCSDMSHQGRRQNAEDMELIRRYLDIFPNFYLLPTEDLDRAMLLELREFTLMATLRFRWLLASVEHALGGVLEVFLDWTDVRKAIYPELGGSDMRHYYRTPQFRLDFIEFLGRHNASDHATVAALLDYERAVIGASPPDSSRAAAEVKLDAGSEFLATDVPLRTEQSRVITIGFELQRVIDALKECREPAWKQDSNHYVLLQGPSNDNPVFHVSPRIAKAVEACDGRRTIAEVMAYLAEAIPDVADDLREALFLGLLQKAEAAGLVAIYRTASEAAPSQGGAFFMPEYNEINAAASAQNMSSAQAQ